MQAIKVVYRAIVEAGMGCVREKSPVFNPNLFKVREIGFHRLAFLIW